MKEVLLDNDDVIIELENGIVSVKGKIAYIDLNTVKQLVQYRLDNTQINSYPLIANIRVVKHFTKEAREFLASEKSSERVTSCAILIDSKVGAMIGNFFVRINKPPVPTKIFSDEKAAKKWLAGHIKIA